MKTKFAVLISAVLMLTGLTACGHNDMSYRPAAFGQSGQCYYVDNPAEAIALQQAELCPSSWIPTVMPLFWHQQYAYYYDYPGYYNRFVPVSSRTIYVTHAHTFENTYRSQIKTASKTAQFRGSDGKTYTGNKIKVGPKTFTGGSNKGGFSGGSNKSKTCGMSQSGYAYKGGGTTGGTSGGSSGFSGGGNRGGYSGGSKGGSSGSTSGGTTRRTSSTGGC